MKNKIDDLRNHLFATLEALRDTDKPMDVTRARAIAEVAQVVVNTAKAEIDYLDRIGGESTGFISRDQIGPPAAAALPRPRLVTALGS